MEEMKHVSSVIKKSTAIRRQVSRTLAVTKSRTSKCSNFIFFVTSVMLLLITSTFKVEAQHQQNQKQLREETSTVMSSIFQKQELSSAIQPPPMECLNPTDPPFDLRQEDSSDENPTQHFLIIDLPQVSPRNLNVDVDYDDGRINILAWKFNPTPVVAEGEQHRQQQKQSLPTTPVECIYQEWKVVDPNSSIDIYSLVMGLDQGRLTISIASKAHVDVPSTASTDAAILPNSDEGESHETHYVPSRIEFQKQEQDETLTAFTNELHLKDTSEGRTEGKRLRGDSATAELPIAGSNNSTMTFHQPLVASKTNSKATKTTKNPSRNTLRKSPRASDLLFFLRSSYSSSTPSLSPMPPPVNQQKFLQISLSDTDEEAYWLRKM